MAKFSYSATKNGKVVSGVVEASSKQAALSTLTNQGIHPHILKVQSSSSKTLHNLLPGKKVKSKDLVVFTRQLSTMVSAGIPLTRALATLKSQTNNKGFKEIIGGISKDVEGGKSLADSLARHPKTFSNVYVNMVRAGETGGILDEILKRLATQVEKDAAIKRQIRSAMTYPTVILTITVIAFFGIMIGIIPKIAEILNDLGGPDAELPSYTKMLLNFSEFLQNNWLLLIVTFALAIFGLRKYIGTKRGRYQLDSLLLKIPVIKAVVTKVAIARFSRTFASLMASGVTVLEALQVTGGAIGNKVIEAELARAAKEVKNGKQLSQSLSGSQHFPPIVPQMLSVGEETGNIDVVLVKVADFYEEEFEATINAISSLIEPVMIIVLGSMVGLIAASVMGPIASLSQNVGS